MRRTPIALSIIGAALSFGALASTISPIDERQYECECNPGMSQCSCANVGSYDSYDSPSSMRFRGYCPHKRATYELIEISVRRGPVVCEPAQQMIDSSFTTCWPEDGATGWSVSVSLRCCATQDMCQ